MAVVGGRVVTVVGRVVVVVDLVVVAPDVVDAVVIDPVVVNPVVAVDESGPAVDVDADDGVVESGGTSQLVVGPSSAPPSAAEPSVQVPEDPSVVSGPPASSAPPQPAISNTPAASTTNHRLQRALPRRSAFVAMDAA